MTPSRPYTIICELILGWFDTIMKAPEIISIIPHNPRSFFKNKKEQISDCASIKFVENYDGYRWLQECNTNKIEMYIIRSVMECI